MDAEFAAWTIWRTYLVIGVIFGLVVVLYGYLSVDISDKEPPFIPQKIPLIGHLLQYKKLSNVYFFKISSEYKLPVYTIALINQKIYVVNSTNLLTEVHRKSKTLSFEPILVEACKAMAGMSKAGLAIAARPGVSSSILKSMHPNMLPGAGLDQLNRSMVYDLNHALDQLEGHQGEVINLFEWIKSVVSVTVSNAVYGPLNPYLDGEARAAFDQLEENLLPLMLNVAPQIIARKGYAAREELSARFLAYFKNNGPDRASAMVKSRFEVFCRHGFELDDIARSEMTNSTGVLSNITPSSFWTTFRAFSNASLKHDLRKECQKVVNVVRDGKTVTNTVDVADLKEKCPLLVSVFQETLRKHSTGSGIRYVTEDIKLDKYELKKGAMIMMPTRVVHEDEATWGKDASNFEPQRFDKDAEKKNPVAFRAFGGGDHMCPGRHFAAATILSLLSMLLLRYDITPVDEAWVAPEPDVALATTASVLPPKGGIKVRMKKLPGHESENWALEYSESSSNFRLITG